MALWGTDRPCWCWCHIRKCLDSMHCAESAFYFEILHKASREHTHEDQFLYCRVKLLIVTVIMIIMQWNDLTSTRGCRGRCKPSILTSRRSWDCLTFQKRNDKTMHPAQMSILMCPRLTEWEWEDGSGRLYSTAEATRQYFTAFTCVRPATVWFYHRTSKHLGGSIFPLLHCAPPNRSEDIKFLGTCVFLQFWVDLRSKIQQRCRSPQQSSQG